jgi:hypothetical protein
VNRNALSLLGVTAALAAVTGVAALTGGGGSASAGTTGSGHATAARLPVQRSTLTCPEPSASELADTTYTAFTPAGTAGAAASSTGSSTGSSGSAGLSAVADDSGDGEGGSSNSAGKKGSAKKKTSTKKVAALAKAGTPVGSHTDATNPPALTGTADGPFAPGWTVQQTTLVDSGPTRALTGVACTVPDSDFWFPGVSTAAHRQDYVHLTNPDDSAAVVDLALYGAHGTVKTTGGNGITVPAHATVRVLLSTLTSERADGLTLHVSARTGRLGAAVDAEDSTQGGDWLTAATEPAESLVLPGIPADATSVHLVAYAPGDDDADLSVKLATQDGPITPAGHESLHVKSGMSTSVDLGRLTHGQADSLILTPTDKKNAAPLVAALTVTRGKGPDREIAFIPATAPITRQATAAGNGTSGSTLYLSAPRTAATVQVTSSVGTKGGTAVTKSVTVKAGSTLALTPPTGAKGTFAVTVRRTGGGPLYAARMLAAKHYGVPMFTVQTLPDDHATVTVPSAGGSLAILNH